MKMLIQLCCCKKMSLPLKLFTMQKANLGICMRSKWNRSLNRLNYRLWASTLLVKVSVIIMSDFCYAETDFKWRSDIKCNKYILSSKSQPIPLITTYPLNHRLTLNIHSLRRSTVTVDDNGHKLQFTDKRFKIHKYLGPFAHRNSVNAHRNSRNVIILATLAPGEMRLALNHTGSGFGWVTHLSENE